MCGIVGCSFVDRESIGRALAAIRHRGPDYTGLYIDDQVTLGHTLLAIRSASDNSKQPYTEGSSPWVLLFNGQIYNTDQIKQKFLTLEERTLELDTAILFRLIQKIGWDFISEIQGMFAIALYHKEQKRLALYRDPSAQKNIYYYIRHGQLIFASEIKALLAFPNISRTVDPLGVELAVSLGYIPGSTTLIQNIKKLNPSESLIFDLSSRSFNLTPFHSTVGDYFSATPNNSSFKQLLAEHAQAKYPVCINLSGGLDSSLLLHELSNAGYKTHTFTNRIVGVGANEQINSDADLALRLSKDYDTRHVEIPVSKEIYSANLIDAYRFVEEPSYNISLPMYLETAKVEGVSGQGERVVLTGHGGDELFGGYSYYEKSAKNNKLRKLLGKTLFNYLKNRRKRESFNYFRPVEQWLAFKYFTGAHTIKPVIISDTINELQKQYDNFTKLYALKEGPIYNMMLCDRFFWQASESFIHSDKIFMSQSVELRAPLSYHPLRLHYDKQLSDNDYFNGGKNKAWLRTRYSEQLPDYILAKGKSGWRVPIESWFDSCLKKQYLEIIGAHAGKKNLIDWDRVIERIKKSEQWPGKDIQVYLSLAILATEFQIDL